MIRLTALFDREAKGMLGFLGMNVRADNSKARQIFDCSPGSFKKTIKDSGRAVAAIQG